MSDKPIVNVSKVDGFGDSLFGAIIAITIAFILFNGDPDIAESLRVVAEKWAASFGDK